MRAPSTVHRRPRARPRLYLRANKQAGSSSIRSDAHPTSVVDQAQAAEPAGICGRSGRWRRRWRRRACAGAGARASRGSACPTTTARRCACRRATAAATATASCASASASGSAS
uniref:Uncharacterized protein n=1 Tax=Zea mays TaxID=4577 RepID=A0A804RES4_MAIZE